MREELDESFTFLDLKALIADSTEMSMEDMRILHKGRAMRDDVTLEAAGTNPKMPCAGCTNASLRVRQT